MNIHKAEVEIKPTQLVANLDISFSGSTRDEKI